MPRGVYARTKRPVAERFWEKVVCDLASGCWLWTGGLMSTGYGSFGMNGVTALAHRVSWELAFGPVPEDQWVLHHCDTPQCVRPDDLFLGDHQANMDDMASKGRAPRGERGGNAKLTEQQVAEMRARHQAGESRISLAVEYGIDHSTICYIIRRDTWAYLH